MKRIFVLLCLICFSIPAFAWSDKGEQASLDLLNRLVNPRVHNFNQSLYADEAKIRPIIQFYKQNPNLIKTIEINEFGKACVARNQNLLNLYEKEYFTPAYNEYLKYDKSLTLEEWIYTVGTSEQSLFYDFYGFTEANLRDCQKIVERSTNR